MRGRDLFKLVKPLIELAVTILRFLPRGSRYGLLALFRGTPGLIGVGVRYLCVRSLARTCGDNVFVGAYTFLTYLEHCDIGNNVSIREFCDIGALGGLTIGNNVAIASGTVILTTEHDYQQTVSSMRDAPLLLKPTIIEDNVWVGSHVGITAGVSIGQGSVIGIGAVVTRSIPPNSIAVGVPARVIGQRGEEAR
jgi:acetyltransferase-like isoleucine patch superfamily enzyme